MKKKLTIKIFLLLSLFGLTSIYFFINSSSVNVSFLEQEQKKIIKKYIAPYIVISEQEDKIYRLEQIIAGQNEEIIMNLLKIELSKIEAGTDIELKKTKESLENNLTLEKFNLLSGFYYGIYNTYPGSGFIDFYEEKIVVLSSRGVLAFNEDISDESESFKQIRTNLKEFIGLEQFKKRSWFSLKDLLIFNEKIFISFTEN